MSKTKKAAADDLYAGSSRGPLDPVAVPSRWSKKGLALQAAATVSTLAYLKLRYETTFVNGDSKQQGPTPSPAAALLLAAEAFAALRALCHLGPFNLRKHEQYRDAADLLAANSYEGCHMVRVGVKFFFPVGGGTKKRGAEGRRRRLAKKKKTNEKKT